MKLKEEEEEEEEGRKKAQFLLITLSYFNSILHRIKFGKPTSGIKLEQYFVLLVFILFFTEYYKIWSFFNTGKTTIQRQIRNKNDHEAQLC